MGLRSEKRQIARARMKAMGLGNVNKKFSLTNHEGRKNWRVALYGKTGADAHRAQMNLGQLLKAKKHPPKRVLKKVSA